MIIQNVLTLDKDFTFHPLDIKVTNGCISQLGNCDIIGDEMLDFSGYYVIPGLIDTHLHGAMGVDCNMPGRAALEKISNFEATRGITTFLSGIVSNPDEMVEQSIINAVDCINQGVPGAKVAGIYLEGPFLSPEYRGAHKLEMLQKPSLEKLNQWQLLAKGHLCKLTVAPELDWAEDVIRWAAANGIIVDIGHSGATYEQAMAGIDWGATVSTHTFNAMVALNHRKPGILGAVLTDDRVTCELIGDFGHVSPVIVKLVYKTKGDNHINLISDSMMAAGMKDGSYELDGRTLYVKDGLSRLEDGTITGGACTIMEGVRNLVSIGIPLESAVKMASINPARTIKKEQRIGSIDIGKCADLVALDKDLNIRYTFVNGRLVYRA